MDRKIYTKIEINRMIAFDRVQTREPKATEAGVWRLENKNENMLL